MEQQPRGDDDEIRLAKGGATFIEEQAEGKTGGGIGHGDDGAHAALDRERLRRVFFHQFLEHLIQHKRPLHKTAVGLQHRARKFKVAIRPFRRLPRQSGVAPGTTQPRRKVFVT